MPDICSPLFNVDGSYSRDEFIFRMRILADDDDPNFVAFIHNQIDWAERHPPETIITFRIAIDGTVYPTASASVNLNNPDHHLEQS